MKKWKFKTRMQVGWFKAAFWGMIIGLVVLSGMDKGLMEDALSSVESISFGPKVKVMINGEIVAVAKSCEEAEDAYKAARLLYNAKGIRLLDVNMECSVADKEKDAKALKGRKVLKDEALQTAIFESFDQFADNSKALAYTVRIDDYTVTLDSMANVVSVLEQTQGQYDTEDAFQVGLHAPSSRNVSMYEVSVEQKKPVSAEVPATEDVSAEVAAQAVEDGVKYIGFSEPIQVTKTYVEETGIMAQDVAYNELTKENATPEIYVVQPGDCLSIIAEKTNLSVDEIKELNPSIESDDDIYYDDRLHITVPKAAVQVLVEKQETYEEAYYEDIVYEDDSSMYIGESEVVQEGEPGRHIVTDMVTYNGDLEKNREQLKETVEVAAVAQIVRRGTKSKPTYMYPVTNWNVTSNFGYRWGRLHAGTDVGVPVGTTVRASRGGQVSVAGWVGGYGNCVMIDHGDGIVTVYGHLSQVLVSVGQYVDQGDQIALSGNTGRSTGPHLHFEIRVNGVAEDAMPYLLQ